MSQRCFTTRNLRTKLCGIRSQTQKQQFVDPFKSWYLETRSDPEMENRLACGKHFSHKDSTKIWNGLYCITWNTILRIPDPESKTIFWEGGVGREVLSQNYIFRSVCFFGGRSDLPEREMPPRRTRTAADGQPAQSELPVASWRQVIHFSHAGRLRLVRSSVCAAGLQAQKQCAAAG